MAGTGVIAYASGDHRCTCTPTIVNGVYTIDLCVCVFWMRKYLRLCVLSGYTRPVVDWNVNTYLTSNIGGYHFKASQPANCPRIHTGYRGKVDIVFLFFFTFKIHFETKHVNEKRDGIWSKKTTLFSCHLDWQGHCPRRHNSLDCLLIAALFFFSLFLFCSIQSHPLSQCAVWIIFSVADYTHLHTGVDKLIGFIAGKSACVSNIKNFICLIPVALNSRKKLPCHRPRFHGQLTPTHAFSFCKFSVLSFSLHGLF